MRASRHRLQISESVPPSSGWHRVSAVTEVTLAFLCVHVTFRGIKHFTALGRLDAAAGLNFTPGAVMIVFTAAVLLLCRRRFSTYGLTFARWSAGLKLGLLWGVLLVAGGALLMLFRVRHQPGGTPPSMKEGLAYGLACVFGVVLFAWLLRRQQTLLNRVRTDLSVVMLVVLLCLPLMLAWHYGRPFLQTLLTVFWLVFGAGVGEEVFYRDYIQSRITVAFGRPFRIGAVQFGAGLLISSLLFGFLHTLNSVDYFNGRFTFAWGFGVAALGAGLLYGCLRESTGSIVAGVVTHSLLDVLVRVPTLMS